MLISNHLLSLAEVTDLRTLKIYGLAEIEHRISLQKVKMTLYVREYSNEKTIYAVVKDDKRHYLLGRITFLALTTIAFHSVHMIEKVNIPAEERAYYFDGNRLRMSMFVDELWCPGNEFYKGIGTALLNIAKEESLSRNCGGRLMLDAAQSSHGFYRKQKLKAMVGIKGWTPEEVDQKIKERSPHTSSIGQVLMYLPKN